MRTLLRPLALASLLAALVSSAACSSSTSPAAPATGLSYTDPPGAGWRLVRNPSSTATRLVLDLVGPAGAKTRGVGLNLEAPPTVRYGTFAATGLPVQDTGVYRLKGAFDDPNEPVAMAGGLKKGHVLTVGVFQKDRIHPAQDSGKPLLQIALEFDATAGLQVGEALSLSVPKAKAIPEDIGQVTDETYRLDQKMRMTPLDVAVGKLAAR